MVTRLYHLWVVFLFQLKTNLSLLSYFCRVRKGQDLYYSDFTAFVFEGSVLDAVLIGIIRASTVLVAAAVFSTTVSIRLVLYLVLVTETKTYHTISNKHTQTLKTRDMTKQETWQDRDRTRQGT
jgi:hypothetical protein